MPPVAPVMMAVRPSRRFVPGTGPARLRLRPPACVAAAGAPHGMPAARPAVRPGLPRQGAPTALDLALPPRQAVEAGPSMSCPRRGTRDSGRSALSRREFLALAAAASAPSGAGASARPGSRAAERGLPRAAETRLPPRTSVAFRHETPGDLGEEVLNYHDLRVRPAPEVRGFEHHKAPAIRRHRERLVGPLRRNAQGRIRPG